jgi:hypothetical protein
VENENFLNTLASFSEEKRMLADLQRLFAEALVEKEIHENDLVLFQLLSFSHYHFLFALSCFMRSHLSEAMSSVRVAIDAALIASEIIRRPELQVAYVRREKPFDKLNRHLKNLVKNGAPLHHTIPLLLNLHDTCSSFASHADVNSFVHRVEFFQHGDKQRAAFGYFQFSRDHMVRKIHTLNIFHPFVMILDLFADYLIDEQKRVPPEWKERVYTLGGFIEQRVTFLRSQVSDT